MQAQCLRADTQHSAEVIRFLIERDRKAIKGLRLHCFIGGHGAAHSRYKQPLAILIQQFLGDQHILNAEVRIQAIEAYPV